MRTEPLVGRKLWFGPRRSPSWGWAPVSWEGWCAILGFAGLSVAASFAFDDGTGPIVIGLAVVLMAICIAKGTRPGGQRAWEDFQARRALPPSS